MTDDMRMANREGTHMERRKKCIRKELKERIMAYLCSRNVRFFYAGPINTWRAEPSSEANSPPLTEHEVSLPHSEQPATGPYSFHILKLYCL